MNKPSLDDIVVAPEVTALSREGVFAALDREDEAVVAAVSQYIGRYAELVGLELKEGRDYLSLLTPTAETPAVRAVAMEIVLETVEEELDSEGEDE